MLATVAPSKCNWPAWMPLMLTTGTTPPMIMGNCMSPEAFRSSGFKGMSEAPNVTVFALICLMPPPDPMD